MQATQSLSVLGQHSQLEKPEKARTALTRCASEPCCTLGTQQAAGVLLSRLSIEDWHCLLFSFYILQSGMWSQL